VTPRQVSVALAGFLMLALGVTYNALYLQGDANRRAEKPSSAADRGKRADVPKSGARAPEPPKRASMLKADAGMAEAAPEPLPEEADIDTVRAIQRELVQRGFGPLTVDGIVRPQTRAAIMAFEHDGRLPLTGEATSRQLERILLGAPPAAEGAGEVRSPHAEALVRHVQRQLAERGYRPGAADGRLGAQTVAAIRAFEADESLAPPKGRISAPVMAKLGERPPGAKAPAPR
jgi:peptidoglycan hydrolase-like protein with peptidoglycan-binding domain